ncbi:MAG: alpha/beta fold hydrolase [Solirubrobacterales bacterium]|nr:alpha/beta fold hydrolase [Solirubrobacterales bacterium]
MTEFQHVKVGGTNVRYFQAGPADSTSAVVFVHGNPGSADDWIELGGALAGLSRVVAPDMPDFGETLAPAGFVHSVETYAGFLEEVLQALHVDRVHLVLHDFGGPFGLAWAGQHAERLKSVTLINTGLLPGYRWHTLARVWRTKGLGEIFQAITTRQGFRLITNLTEPRGLPRHFVDTTFDHYDARTKRAVLKLYRATDDPGAGTAELTKALSQHDIPALVIWGEDDRYIPASFADRQRDAFPDADIHLLPVSGHWPHADAPDRVQRLLVEFISDRGVDNSG